MIHLKKTLFSFFTLFFFSSYSYSASVNINTNVQFRIGYSTLEKEDYIKAKTIAEIWNSYQTSRIQVNGHTDSTGADEINQELSEARAKSFKDLLVRYGVSETSIDSRGFGEHAPIADNSSYEGRRKNRRVVATIYVLTNEEAKEVKELVESSGLFEVLGVENDEVEEEIKVLESEALIEEGDDQDDSSYIEETEEEVLNKYTQDEETPPVEEEPEAIIENEAVEEVIELEEVTEIKEETKPLKKRRSFKRSPYIIGLIGPNWSSNYYDQSLSYEHGELKFLSFGLKAGMRLNKKLSVEGSVYYLPNVINEADSGIDFLNDSIDYENTLYDLELSYRLKQRRSDRLSLLGGHFNHNLGGLSRSALNEVRFRTFTHQGLYIGLRYERKLLKNWVLDSRFKYLYALDVSNVESSGGFLRYQIGAQVKRRLSKKWVALLEYQATYHETEMEFEGGSGFMSDTEFFIQTLMFGLKYKF